MRKRPPAALALAPEWFEMTETRDMILGGRTFSVPPLPLGANMQAYPLLRKLHNAGLVERWLTTGGLPTEEDMQDLATVLFICAQAADPAITTADFLALPITPPEMFAGMLVARFQCGAWTPLPEGAEPGEWTGEPKPPTSTSAESSPA